MMIFGEKKSSPQKRSLSSAPGDSEVVRKLAIAIEKERYQIGELSLDELSSPRTIGEIRRLEQLINEYVLITSCRANRSGRIRR